MGTIGNQSPRDHYHYLNEIYNVEVTLVRYIALAKKLKVDLGHVLKMREILEHERANDIAADDGDYRDEHADGYADVFFEAITKLAEAIEKAGERISRQPVAQRYDPDKDFI